MPFLKTHEGVSYREYIVEVTRRKSARSYLEVGVRDGETLALVDTDCIGIDPHFVVNRDIIARKNKLFLFQMTSDEFFRAYDPRVLLQSPVDVVFLDGLHQFEYLLRDFFNTEAVCHRDSVIMLDDCLPNNAEMTERTFRPDQRAHQQTAHWWTGDVWKVVSILQKFRPDLYITAADTQPTGNVAVTNLDPTSTLLRDRYYEIVSEFAAIASDDDALEAFYKGLDIQSTKAILSGFDASLYIGP